MFTPATYAALAKIIILIIGLMTAAAYLVLVERWMAAWIQDRKGPNRVGIPFTKIRLFGLGQPLADGLKMLFKEDYTPGHVDKALFALAPIIIMSAALAIFAVIPFGSVVLIGGYHTEYSGMKLLLFLIAEFLHMITAAFLIVILFFGGWHLWGLTGSTDEVTWPIALLRIVVLGVKVLLVILFFMLVRWSWPRFRFDQLMALAWKVMLPLGLVNFVAVAVMQEARHALGSKAENLGWTLMVIVFSWGICIAAWLATAFFNPLVTDNRPRR